MKGKRINENVEKKRRKRRRRRKEKKKNGKSRVGVNQRKTETVLERRKPPPFSLVFSIASRTRRHHVHHPIPRRIFVKYLRACRIGLCPSAGKRGELLSRDQSRVDAAARQAGRRTDVQTRSIVVVVAAVVVVVYCWTSAENARRDFDSLVSAKLHRSKTSWKRLKNTDDLSSKIWFLVAPSIKDKVIWDFSEFYRR